MANVIELWRPVLGFEGIYEVSSEGRVKRIGRAPRAQIGHILVSGKDRQGYMRIKLCKDSIAYARKVHRLVAEAFVGPIQPLMTVNHIDGNKQNNAVGNLEVVTRAANISHAFYVIKTKTNAGERNPKAKLTVADVHEIRRALAAGETGVSLGRRFGISKDAVSNINTGKTWATV